MVLAHDLKVAVWQWPEHRVLWGKQLPAGWTADVAEEAGGAMICPLEGDHYFVLWPENTQQVEEAEPRRRLAAFTGAR